MSDAQLSYGRPAQGDDPGNPGSPGDKLNVARRISFIVSVASLAWLLSTSASAAAVGLQKQRVVGAADRSVSAASSTGRPVAGGLIAPAGACPGQDRLDAPARAQEATMLCMTNFARMQAGMAELVDSSALDQSAEDKSWDVLSCDSFSHFACGREFTYWMRETGYLTAPCWRVGENLAWGINAYGSVGSIFRALIRSQSHRENILGDYNEIGIDVRVGDLEGHVASHVWTQHFGSHCEDPQPESMT
jgi:uncharacterized protein YkwD